MIKSMPKCSKRGCIHKVDTPQSYHKYPPIRFRRSNGHTHPLIVATNAIKLFRKLQPTDGKVFEPFVEALYKASSGKVTSPKESDSIRLDTWIIKLRFNRCEDLPKKPSSGE